ncbi:MAG: Nif3-like dinuclear metal center hexameric protein [Clostridia bacterium]|nr:Nif3-like dinuclear metal center hexameric protein [Clostridia bacterium]
MASINELYNRLEEAIPAELSCDWDNDGRMVVPNGEKDVKKALICLDVTESAIDYAIENGFDCIISHHPIIFHGIKNIDADNYLSRKLCKLIKNDISVFSFHTRLDKVSGGVNDAIADLLGLKNVTDFSDVGRMGEIDLDKNSSVTESFAALIKEALNVNGSLTIVDSGRVVKKVAIVGGSGKEYIEEAYECGCDTLITGEAPYNCQQEAKGTGINLVLAGHYFTENVVCPRIEILIKNFDMDIYTEIYNDTNPATER